MLASTFGTPMFKRFLLDRLPTIIFHYLIGLIKLKFHNVNRTLLDSSLEVSAILKRQTDWLALSNYSDY